MVGFDCFKKGKIQFGIPPDLVEVIRELEKLDESVDLALLDESKQEMITKLRGPIIKLPAIRDNSLAELPHAIQLGLIDFLVYAPENAVLRAFDPEAAIAPLGSKGEGLLKLLQSFGDERYQDRFDELKEFFARSVGSMILLYRTLKIYSATVSQ